MRLIAWLVRAFIFFGLFAFALNNQEPATVHWFFGLQWRTPMIIVVLVAFAAGAAVGVLAMVPSWWRARRAPAEPAASEAAAVPRQRRADGSGPASVAPALTQPPREAL